MGRPGLINPAILLHPAMHSNSETGLIQLFSAEHCVVILDISYVFNSRMLKNMVEICHH